MYEKSLTIVYFILDDFLIADTQLMTYFHSVQLYLYLPVHLASREIEPLRKVFRFGWQFRRVEFSNLYFLFVCLVDNFKNFSVVLF